MKEENQERLKAQESGQEYVAPENVGVSSVNTHKGDIFALGLCIIELFYDNEPQKFNEAMQRYFNVQDINKRLSKNYPLDIKNNLICFLNNHIEKISRQEHQNRGLQWNSRRGSAAVDPSCGQSSSNLHACEC